MENKTAAETIKEAGKYFLEEHFSEGISVLSVFINEPNILMHHDATKLLRMLDSINLGEISPDDLIQVVELKGLAYTRTGDYLGAIEVYRNISVRSSIELRIRLIRYIIQYGGRKQSQLRNILNKLKKETFTHISYKDLIYIYHRFVSDEDLSDIYNLIYNIKNDSPFIITELIYIMDWYAQYLCDNGESDRAVEVLIDAREKIRNASNKNTLNTITQVDLAIAYSYSGNHDDSMIAISLLNLTLDTLAIYLDKDAEAYVHHNLGSIYLDIAKNRMDIQKSIIHLSKSVEYLNDNKLASKRSMYILRYISLLDAYNKSGQTGNLKDELSSIDTFIEDDNEYISWFYLSKIQFYIIKKDKKKAVEHLDLIRKNFAKQNLIIKLWWIQLSLEVSLLLGGDADQATLGSLLDEIGGKLAGKETTSYFAHYELARGLFAMSQGKHEDAIASLENSVAIRQECKYTYYAGESLVWLVKAYTLAGNYDKATATEKTARTTLTPFGKATPLLQRLNRFRTELKKAQESNEPQAANAE